MNNNEANRLIDQYNDKSREQTFECRLRESDAKRIKKSNKSDIIRINDNGSIVKCKVNDCRVLECGCIEWDLEIIESWIYKLYKKIKNYLKYKH